jgi:2-methoxy-6-polyprenyl-1,4-benzoquinol methylase
MLRAWLRVRAAAATSGSAASGATSLHQWQHQYQSEQRRGYAPASSPLTTDGAAAASASATTEQNQDPNQDTVDYGFRQVPRADKERLVGGVFSSVAQRYDAMNDLMSGGMHRLWKRSLVDGDLRPFPGMRHLDVAGGTGDVAFRVLRAVRAAERAAEVGGGSAAAAAGRAAPASGGPGPSSSPSSQREGSVVVCDINPDMLAVGQKRASAEPDLCHDKGLEWVEGNAESLPFSDDSFDSYTVAFGIRNVTDRPAALREARRVLKPGGRLLVLELCPPQALSHRTLPASLIPGAGAALEAAYDAYSLKAIPRLGAAVAGDESSYRYLVESIRRFPPPDEFAALVREAGFAGVGYRLMSAGIVAVHSGFKL